MNIPQLDLVITEAIQTAFQGFTPLMKFLSFIGEPPVYLVIVFLLAWFYDYKTGARLAVVVTFSALLQSTAKLIFRQPRPYLVSDRIIQRVSELGFGFPSGHSLVGTTFYTFIMRQWKYVLIWIVGIVLIILTGLSRICLGGHSFFQVAAGWILGIAVVLGYFYFEKKIGNIFFSLGLLKKILLVCGLFAVLVIPSLPSSFIVGKMSFEQFLWEGEIGLPAGIFLGISIGTVLFSHKEVAISMKVSRRKNLVKFVIMILTVASFMLLSGLVEVITNKTIVSLSMFALSFLLGIWGMYIAPTLFMKWGFMEEIRN